MQVLVWTFCCFSLVYFGFAISDNEERCYKGTGVIKRNFFVDGSDLPLLIEVSQRISHRLISHIARILLEEVLGYQSVELVKSKIETTTETFKVISSCDDPKNCPDQNKTIPKFMINLEVWLPPSFNLESWIKTEKLEDLGPLGPIGRSGWFVAKSVVDYFWRGNGTIIDHYKAWLNEEITRKFDLSLDGRVVNKSKEACKESSKTVDIDCGIDGFYRPSQCKKEGSVCATLLSDYPASTFHILKDVIQKYRLLVNIAWLGNDSENSLLKMYEEKKTFILFYGRNPTMLSSMVDVTHISFPGCEPDFTQCEFEVQQLQKVVWTEIKENAFHAFSLLRAMSFPKMEYTKLLRFYHRSKDRYKNMREIACKWVKQNESLLFKEWLPRDHLEKTTLYIGGIFPISGIYQNQDAVIEAAELAAEYINNQSSILPRYTLEILKQDGHCRTDEVMKSFIHYVQSRTFKTMVGILGPACTDTVEPIAGVATHFHTLIISYSAEGTLIENPEKYPFFFRTIPENNIFRFVYLKLLQKLGFRRLASLTEADQKYPEYIAYLEELVKTEKMEFVKNGKFRRQNAYTNMKAYLTELKNAKIIIGDFYDYAARSVMCTAFNMGMTAVHGYIWFLPSWFSADWYDTDKINMNLGNTEQVNCTTEQMVEALNGHMSLEHKFFADPDTIMEENRTVQKWRGDYEKLIKKHNKKGSNYAGYTYDAVWVYAHALDRLFGENESHVATLHTERTSSRFVELLKETNITGVTGQLYFQDKIRMSDVIISQWINRSRKVVGVYRPSSPKDGELELNETEIIWLTPNGQKPEDGSEGLEYCDVESFRKLFNINSCLEAQKYATLFGVGCFVLFILTAIVVFKTRYDKKMAETEERIKELGLSRSEVPFALDQWELPREHIVMNRKLGEGAFGTVYGGEALVKSKGWIAVAIKTLKRGAKTEEKLDFLGEAEVMKRFDHINIVKLVGVCTTGEPVYTIMEFMLYGDLKTYLLDRRNMASEKERFKNDEVSDKRLTNMALDIARGLSYLADQKFVHRDLACRNCLVNTSRSVKIADFGMCRAMFDSDYYRNNKKGMLPIRWMAPESLIDGLFTPKSDVWSYGVVLYEIITFASFPYRGFSHDQVLNHVKSNKTLPIPVGCKPELEQLLLKCWSSAPQNRPHAAEIVEILALNPELITPCLDVPASSIDLDNSNSLAENDRARGHSFSSVWQHRKSVVQHDQNHTGVCDTSHLSQNAHESAHDSRNVGPKHLNKKSLQESFKKNKRKQHKEKTVELLPQITYL